MASSSLFVRTAFVCSLISRISHPTIRGELLAINQDTACRQPYPIKGIWQDSVTAYAKNLAGGDIAIGLFNLGSEKAVSRFNLDELGLPHSTGKTLKLADIWTGKEANTANASISWELEPFDCAVFRAKVVDRK